MMSANPSSLGSFIFLLIITVLASLVSSLPASNTSASSGGGDAISTSATDLNTTHREFYDDCLQNIRLYPNDRRGAPLPALFGEGWQYEPWDLPRPGRYRSCGSFVTFQPPTTNDRGSWSEIKRTFGDMNEKCLRERTWREVRFVGQDRRIRMQLFRLDPSSSASSLEELELAAEAEGGSSDNVQSISTA